MASMESKPTSYKGTMYRSRLEARWAVYLDHHKSISQYVYEPPGWQGYTPDFLFRLASQEIYMEVKPVQPSTDYLQRLITTVKRARLDYFLLAVGSFYQEVPILWSMVTGRGCIIPAGQYLSKSPLYSEYALRSASGYRFDLRNPESGNRRIKYDYGQGTRKRKRRL